MSIGYIANDTIITWDDNYKPKMQNEDEVDAAIADFKKNGFCIDIGTVWNKLDVKSNDLASVVKFYKEVHNAEDGDVEAFTYQHIDGTQHAFVKFNPKNFTFEKVLSDNTKPFVNEDKLGVRIFKSADNKDKDNSLRTGEFNGIYGASIKIISEKFKVASYIIYDTYLKAFIDEPRCVSLRTGTEYYLYMVVASFKYAMYHRINPIWGGSYGIFRDLEDFSKSLKISMTSSLDSKMTKLKSEINDNKRSKQNLEDEIQEYEETIASKTEKLNKIQETKKHIEDDVVSMLMNANLRGNS